MPKITQPFIAITKTKRPLVIFIRTMSMWPVEKAEETLRRAMDDIGKALVIDVLKAVDACETFSAISDLSRRLIGFETEYQIRVWDDVSLAIWNKADELAVAEMPEAIRAIVAEMDFANGRPAAIIT